jgi:anti-anti-sigma factor
MNALLLSPGRRPAVALLAEAGPLAVAPLLGRCLAEYWIEHLAARGFTEIAILCPDRADDVAARVGDGTRWGLSIAVMAADGEISADAAREKYGASAGLIVQMDHLPGLPDFPLLGSYAAWFAGLQAWMPKAQAIDRIGQCEVQPGIWVGLRARIDPATRFVPPCWIGDHVSVNRDAVIGPGAILEDGVVVGPGACVVRSVVGPATLVGAHTRVENSIAHRDTLIGWTDNSCLRVPNAFWLCSLREPLAARRPDARPSPSRIEAHGSRLCVTDLDELSAANAGDLVWGIQAALSPSIVVIDLDMANLRFLDGCGLATLCRLHQGAGAAGVGLRLIDPTSSVEQLIALTQTNQILTVGRSEQPGCAMPKPAHRRIASPSLALAY